MPRKAQPLSALGIRKKIEALSKDPTFTKPVKQSDGGMPCLQIVYAPAPDGVSAKWVYRKQHKDTARRFEAGLGVYGERPPGVSLQRAREKAAEITAMLAQGIHPLDEKRRRKEELAEAKKAAAAAVKYNTPLSKVALLWLEDQDKAGKWADDSRGYQRFRGYLKNWIIPALGNLPLDEIGREEVFDFLQRDKLYMKVDTADKCRSTLTAIGTWAYIHGYRRDDKEIGKLDGILRERLKPYLRQVPKRGHNPALRPEDMPEFMSQLKRHNGPSARALEFLILTACRQDSIVNDRGKVLGLRWEHLDLDAGIWHLPRDWTKMKKEMDLVLSTYAVDLLKSLPRVDGCPFVFPDRHGTRSLALGTLGLLINNMNGERSRVGLPKWVDPRYLKNGEPRAVTPHGMRATFTTWARQGRDNFKRFNPDTVELCVGHAVRDRLGGAYYRPELSGELIQQCRDLMNAWGRFCLTGKWPDEPDDE